MVEKEATASIYTDMVAAGDLCKVVTNGVGHGYQIHVFNGKEYLPFKQNSMSFDDACNYLSAIYKAVYTINKKPITEVLFGNHAVKLVMRYANRAFRQGYNRGYAEAKAAYEKAKVVYEKTKTERAKEDMEKCDEKMAEILRIMSRNDILKLTRNPAQADKICNDAKDALDDAIKQSIVSTVTPSEFETKKADYASRIQDEGVSPVKRK